MEVTLIFPNQLFKNHPALHKNRKVILIEDHLFFSQYAFHKQKIVFHRASMQAFAHRLNRTGFNVQYLACREFTRLADVFAGLYQQGYRSIHYADTTDFLLEKRINRNSEKNNLRLVRHESPAFFFTTAYLDNYFGHSKKKYLQTEFYIRARKNLNILMEDGLPKGGKWTFDTENRKPFPPRLHPPEISFPAQNTWVVEAQAYVSRLFADNPGQAEGFCYPVKHEDADRWLEDFLQYRLRLFGPYQDAFHPKHTFLFHSVLSPLLNSGLLLPQQVLEKTLAFSDQKKIPLQSAEGFVRQIIGWREFIRGVYIHAGVQQRKSNFFSNTCPVPAALYAGTTGMPPVDDAVTKLKQHAYVHHIERLMVLGNWMLLCGIHPDNTYQWFMEWFIDAYDWVMVPNVYGMSQYADGGLMATKPYISGSNYILKMSAYRKEAWAEIWNALYWRFIDIHQDKLRINPRMRMMVERCRSMSSADKHQLFRVADMYLEQLYGKPA